MDFSLVYETLPLPMIAAFVFVLGAIIGSFLNVYIYRFHTGKSLAGRSHCLSCATPLKWYDLFPIVSYLWLRGRCRACGCRIPARYMVVELATALLFAGALTLTSNLLVLGLWWFMVAVLVVITVYDIYHFIIPDELTAVLTAVALALFFYEHWGKAGLLENFLVTLGAAATGAGFFLVLWLVSRGQWLGFGDVKLALPLGFLAGPTLVFSFVVYSFWIGAAVSLCILGYQRWRRRGQTSLHLRQAQLTMKSAVPFAPFLVASALVIAFTGTNVLTLFHVF